MGNERVSAKAGFDLTIPFAERGNSEWAVPEPPDLTPAEPRFESVEAALRDGPRQFGELMRCLGSADGREIVVELEALRENGRLAHRRPGGRYYLK